MIASDLLDTVVAATRHSVETRQQRRPASELERCGTRRPRGEAFIDALTSTPVPRIIAECKRRSPSRGILRQDYDPAAHAVAYARAGAAAISVLTEPTFFDGAPSHLAHVREEVDLPLLRKDFIISDYQLIEAAALGADAALLLVGALDDRLLQTLLATCERLGLAALVEVHDRTELGRAVQAGARIIGVNSRNLRTLDVDSGLHEALAPALPPGIVAVAESGIRTTADVVRLTTAGYHAFLVGERLITQPDPAVALRELRGL
jgi:indole-3-glycerol phosphate synthase